MDISFIIDGYREEDYSVACQLWETAALPVLDTEEIAGVYAHGGQLLVARDAQSGVVVGTVMWTFDGSRATVRKVAVHKNFRRKGIAEALLVEARQQMQGTGIKLALLFVEQDNSPAKALYGKLGWKCGYHKIESWHIKPQETG